MPYVRTTVDAGGRHRHSRPRPSRDRRHLIGIGAGALATLLSATLFLAFGYGWYNFRDLNQGAHHLALNNVVGGADQHADATTSGVTGETQNILLVGLDSRSGLSTAQKQMLHVGTDTFSLSTDTIMIVHIPADGSKATMISIPRDSFVDIPDGYLKNKINGAYADAYSDATGSEDDKQAAGADLLIATVKKLTGLTIDHYVQVNFEGFYQIAKAIGKIPVNLCAPVNDTIHHNRINGGGGGSGFKMSAGHHDLNAVQALEFVRQRHNLHGGDYARVQRQRYFLATAFDQIASAGFLLNPIKLHNLIHEVNGAFYTDNGLSPLALADQLVNLTGNNITGRTIPTKGTGVATVAGVQVDVDFVDPKQVRAFVAKVISGAAGKHKHHKHHRSSAPKRDCIY
jgi:LCP family protein required for cell wall assembly